VFALILVVAPAAMLAAGAVDAAALVAGVADGAAPAPLQAASVMATVRPRLERKTNRGMVDPFVAFRSGPASTSRLRTK
jgi:hypothetical protein